jgi:salicylate hydroxylase
LSHFKPSNFAAVIMRATIKETSANSVSNGHISERLNHKTTQNLDTPHHPPNLIASCPSQALRFLEKAHEQTGKSSFSASLPEQACYKMTIIVVDAGLGGLALAIALARRGHSFRVLKQAAESGEVRASFFSRELVLQLSRGAGIRIPPNSGRLLHDWSVFEHS